MMDGSGVLCKCSSNLCSILQGGVMLITVVPLCWYNRNKCWSNAPITF
jgi:hypothetical protein